MSKIKQLNAANKPTDAEKTEMVEFLYEHLEIYGDSKIAIEKAIDYATMVSLSFGGFVLISYLNDQISGIVVVNKTGMSDYIPENILVYIATHKDQRGKGIGKQLMQKTIELAKGNIALHVEAENPAKFLYENVGFVKKYVEMRLIK